MKQTIPKFNNNQLNTNKSNKICNNKNEFRINDLNPGLEGPRREHKNIQKYDGDQLRRYKQYKNNTRSKIQAKKQSIKEKRQQQIYRQLQQKQQSFQRNYEQPTPHSFSFFGCAIKGKKIKTINSIVDQYFAPDNLKDQDQLQHVQRRGLRKISNPEVDDKKESHQFVPYRSSYLAKTGMQPRQENQQQRQQRGNKSKLSLSLDIKKAICLYHTTPNFKSPAAQKPSVIVPPPECAFITHNQFLSHSYYSNNRDTRSLVVNHSINSNNSCLNKEKIKNSIQVTLYKKNLVKLLYAGLTTMDIQRSGGYGGMLFGARASTSNENALNMSRKNSNTLNISKNKRKQVSALHPRVITDSKTVKKGVIKGRSDQGQLNKPSPPKLHLLLHMKRRIYNRRRSFIEAMQNYC